MHIPNGITAWRFKPLKKEKYILAVSRLVHAKWIQDLLLSLKGVELWDWRIKIVWEWPLEDELKQRTIDYWISKNTEFIWWVDNNSEQMKELYGKASIFCQPSHFENMSIVLLEAMEAWCAIIARDVGWNKEVISPEGLYETETKLKEQLSTLFTNEKLLKSNSQNNIRKVKEFYSENIAKKYLDTMYS